MTDFQLDVLQLIVMGLAASAAWCGVFLGRKAVMGIKTQAEANATQTISTHTYTGDNLTVLHTADNPGIWTVHAARESDRNTLEED